MDFFLQYNVNARLVQYTYNKGLQALESGLTVGYLLQQESFAKEASDLSTPKTSNCYLPKMLVASFKIDDWIFIGV